MLPVDSPPAVALQPVAEGSRNGDGHHPVCDKTQEGLHRLTNLSVCRVGAMGMS